MDAIEVPKPPAARESAKTQVSLDNLLDNGPGLGIAGDQTGDGPLMVQVGDKVVVVDRKAFLKAATLYAA